MDITGRKLFVKALQEEGVDTIFGYPGGTVTDLFDELYKQDEIEIVLPRHEQGLLHEAEGYAKSTGKVGVCLVTSGPGATNIMTGLADAHYDNIPLVCFTGQVPLNLIGNDAFQEVDIVGMTRSITKYGVTVRDRKDLGKIIKMAFHIASTGKPGPVLIDLPKDIQTASGPAEYPTDVLLFNMISLRQRIIRFVLSLIYFNQSFIEKFQFFIHSQQILPRTGQFLHLTNYIPDRTCQKQCQ